MLCSTLTTVFSPSILSSSVRFLPFGLFPWFLFLSSCFFSQLFGSCALSISVLMVLQRRIGLGLSALLACCYRPTLYTVTHLQSANIYHSAQLITSVNYSVISYLLAITSRTHLSDRYRTQHDSFYRAMLCIRGTSHGPVSVCLSVSVCIRVCHNPVFY